MHRSGQISQHRGRETRGSGIASRRVNAVVGGYATDINLSDAAIVEKLSQELVCGLIGPLKTGVGGLVLPLQEEAVPSGEMQPGVLTRPRRACDAVRWPGILEVGFIAEVRPRINVMVTSRYHQVVTMVPREDTVHRRGHCRSSQHCEGPAFAEVTLHVYDDQCTAHTGRA